MGLRKDKLNELLSLHENIEVVKKEKKERRREKRTRQSHLGRGVLGVGKLRFEEKGKWVAVYVNAVNRRGKGGLESAADISLTKDLRFRIGTA